MPRLTPEQAEQAITDTITAAGGTMTHNDLEQALSDAGMPNAITYVLGMSQRQEVRAVVRARPEGAPVLTYVIPPEPQPTQPE